MKKWLKFSWISSSYFIQIRYQYEFKLIYAYKEILMGGKDIISDAAI